MTFVLMTLGPGTTEVWRQITLVFLFHQMEKLIVSQVLDQESLLCCEALFTCSSVPNGSIVKIQSLMNLLFFLFNLCVFLPAYNRSWANHYHIILLQYSHPTTAVEDIGQKPHRNSTCSATYIQTKQSVRNIIIDTCKGW